MGWGRTRRVAQWPADHSALREPFVVSTQIGPDQPRPPEARSLPRARPLAVAPQRLGLSLAVLSVAAFVAGLDLFIVNVAFDAISRDFGGAALADLSWVLNGYAIVFAALLVPLGPLSDRLGHKRVFVLGLALFTAASAACALATGLWVLVVCRVLQAVGAAALTPATLGLLLSVFPAERRQVAVRVWSASAALAAAAGPVFGGLLVSVSWRWVFLVNIPIGVLALLVAVRVLPESREATARHLPDLAGTCLLTGSIGLLALGLVKVNDWSAGLTSTLLVAAAGGGAAFWRRSRNHPAPVIEPALLRVRAFAWSNVTALVFTAAFAANLLTAILWMQQVWGYSALRTGLGIAPGPLMVPVAALVAGRLASRLAARGTDGGGLPAVRRHRRPRRQPVRHPAAGRPDQGSRARPAAEGAQPLHRDHQRRHRLPLRTAPGPRPDPQRGRALCGGRPPRGGDRRRAALVTIIGDYLAQSLDGHPGPIELTDVDNAFNAFSAALTDLLNVLPPGADPGVRALLERVRQTVATWNNGAGQVLSVRQALEKAGRGAKLPETVNARLEWNPEIKPFPACNPVFVPHEDDQGRTTGRFSLVVDLRGSLRSDLTAGADVTCCLEEFDLVLIPDFKAMRLNFERIRFTARVGKKLDVDVAFRGVRFTGPLSFVETLRQLIPIDGFSDPPGIQVTSSGIVASYALPLLNLAVGVFSLENLRLAAYLDLPFVGKSLEVGYSFCTRQAPFRLTFSMLGGGGFFGIVLTPKRVAVLEAALELCAAVSMNFGVASGSLSVMAGICFRLELDTGEARLSGYFRARGEVDVLGIVSASIELYLELIWQPGRVSGRARISVSIHIGFWSQSVTIECEKTFLGGGGNSLAALGGAAADAVRPPTFAEMMSPYPDPVTGVQRVPVDEYCTAFAEVS